MKKKLQVFISSTYTDLLQERQAAVEAVLKAGHIPAGMELFASGDESQLETIKRWIRGSDIYMLILGGRYGTIEPKASLSYVELEYDYAVSEETPTFAVVINDAAIEQRVRDRGREVIEQEHPKELKLFREKVLSRTSSFFDDPKDVKLAVHETLSGFEDRHAFSGWIRAKDVASVTTLVEELSRASLRNRELEKEVRALRTKAERASKTASEAWTDQDFAAILDLLKPIEVEVSSGTEAEAATHRLPVTSFLLTCRDELVRGVSNSGGSGEVDRLLFFNVCPKLAVHELAALEKVAGVQWRRYALTPKGRALLVYMDRVPSVESSSEEKVQKRPTATNGKKRVRSKKAEN